MSPVWGEGADLACQEGVEPPTARLEGGCSIQLSYWQYVSEVYVMAQGGFAKANPCLKRDTRARQGRQRDSNKALLTTLTLLMAMAAPASIGLRPPKAASGIPMTL